ncbi:uncharacterized protein B0I36DRAFT_375909 [Microdochium trichocladiopsis]|uniref:GATA-type domain-containing protein n=1 Tax=Microdochium trichocladiopsis TaxID=1682393 RepID=A0A9P8Y2F9_9PEZI|nr:uncharacterized protein B0I36DRAFT_375909 [Microdochium trichocladiopsis]KAH7025957.1 hypothetical protein B0I36DRAFT_375909 [Microdochium trichocladiopsis]
MATAALLNPSPAYPHTAPFTFSQPQHHSHHPPHPPRPPLTAVSVPGMGPPPESRTLAQDNDASQRQSLPSLSEVFSTTKTTPYSPKPAPINGLTSQAPGPSFHAAHSRQESLQDTRPPHQPLEDKFFRFTQRPDSSASAHPTGPPPYIEQRDLSKASEPLRPEPNHVAGPPAPLPPSGPRTSLSQPTQLPPGQYPLSQPSVSPRHNGPFPSYEPQGPPPPTEADYVRNRYDHTTVNRHIEAWSYQDCLNKIAWHARTVSNFAEAYSKIASEQHGGHTIPERLPSDSEVIDMLSNVDFIKQSLTNVRDLVQQSIASEKARQLGRPKHAYDGDEDVTMYADGSSNKSYGIGEVKKRRGRAAPPGRCHSCNRIDTPEWRRGPDGARTLCNACGLHYAKLERKRQMEQRSIRPKGVEDRA